MESKDFITRDLPFALVELVQNMDFAIAPILSPYNGYVNIFELESNQTIWFDEADSVYKNGKADVKSVRFAVGEV